MVPNPRGARRGAPERHQSGAAMQTDMRRISHTNYARSQERSMRVLRPAWSQLATGKSTVLETGPAPQLLPRGRFLPPFPPRVGRSRDRSADWHEMADAVEKV